MTRLAIPKPADGDFLFDYTDAPQQDGIVLEFDKSFTAWLQTEDGWKQIQIEVPKQ